MEKQKKIQQYEAKHSKLWAQCQRCQGTLHTDILCSNSDCPIFYMRIKAQNDLEDATKVLQEFKW